MWYFVDRPKNVWEDKMIDLSQEAVLDRRGYTKIGPCDRQRRRYACRYGITVIVDGNGFEWAHKGDKTEWIRGNPYFKTYSEGTWISPRILDQL
jgi:hypothetical protein